MAKIKTSQAKAIREYGDFQTPSALASAATDLLAKLGLTPATIIEPTCGKGAFVVAAAKSFPSVQNIVGYEINACHLTKAETQSTPFEARIALHQGNFFELDWPQIVSQQAEPLLIVGNPPWVTSSELGAIESANLPTKVNFQGHNGLDALTGKANFDISEYMILKYIEWMNGKSGAIGVLCKTSVARKILLQRWKQPKSQISEAHLYKIDALAYFGAAVDACFFVVQLTTDGESRHCAVFDDISAAEPIQVLGYDSGHIIPDMSAFIKHRHLLGPERHYVWRSGVKHDCAKVMELWPDDSNLLNGLNESVNIEAHFLYPMLKSSDVGNGRTHPRAFMIVTQRNVGDRTDSIRLRAPLTWQYLESKKEFLEKRGSSIYQNKPRFSIFGVGDYTFSPWKVAISGFYKRLNFLKVGPKDGKPIVFDDTIYFLSCESEDEADFLLELFTSETAQTFYNSMIYWDEKRPVTVDVLKRLNLHSLAKTLDREAEYLRFTQSQTLPLFDPAPTSRLEHTST